MNESSPTTTLTAADHHCPPWCVVTQAQHDAELTDCDGGALHWSTPPWEDRVPATSVAIASATDASGATTQEPTIYVGVTELKLAQAREVLAGLGEAVRALDGERPAGPKAMEALAAMLDAINEPAGTWHTLESLAEACGVDLAEATEADASTMACHVGGVLMAS